MPKDVRNSVPSKLLYKGRVYKLAETERGKIWRRDVVPRLKVCLEIAEDEDLYDYDKLHRIRQPWSELKSLLQLVGLL